MPNLIPDERPAPHADTRGGLALHPASLEPFEKKLAAGPGLAALAASKKAFEIIHGSLGDMQAALAAAPRVKVGVKIDIAEEAKPALRDAMARSFERGAKTLEEAERVIDDTHKVLTQTINASLINPRRNETSVSAMHSQIRDVVRAMPQIERSGFIRSAILEKDVDVTTAVLGSSPYASGLTRAQQSDLRIDAERQFAPEAFKTRADLEALRASAALASANYLQRYVAKVPAIPQAASKSNAALKRLRDGVAA